jgi:hypothetical protein
MDATPARTNTTNPAPVAPRRRRGVRRVAVALALAGATVAGVANTASAGESVQATSYGMQCSSQYGWVRENYPNISIRSAANQNVFFMVTLQQFTASGWVSVQTSQWFVGVSNVTGRKALGYLGGQPYYFAVSLANGTYPAPERGPAFTGLRPGYYRTVETYWSNGTQSSNYSYDVDNSTSSYCYA